MLHCSSVELGYMKFIQKNYMLCIILSFITVCHMEVIFKAFKLELFMLESVPKICHKRSFID